MSDLFLPDGHLTDYALTALLDGSLDELGRLEAGEHLSFCDTCLERYTALLTQTPIQMPETDQTLPVMRRLRRRQRMTAVHRYASAAAAVAIGSFLWYTGVFDTVAKTLTESPDKLLRPQSVQQQVQRPEKPSIGDFILDAVDDWSARIWDATAPAFRVPSSNRREKPSEPQQSNPQKDSHTDKTKENLS